MINPNLTVCLPCWQESLKRGDKDKYNLINRLAEKFKNEKFKTVALIRTKEKGHLTWRHLGDESIKDHIFVEFISFMSGVAV